MTIGIAINFDVTGAARHLDRLQRNTLFELDNAIKDIGQFVAAQAKSNINRGARTGKWYKSRGRKDTWHQASASGEYPKTDTGRLVTSIRSDNVRFLTTEVGSDIDYAAKLEGDGRSLTPGARPWLRRTIEENSKTINEVLRRALARALNTGDKE